MAGGKQTPRQKMINMMYLVLTALLALNISKDILDALTKLNTSLEGTVQTVENKNSDIYSAFTAAAAENPAKAKEWKDKAFAVKAESDDLYNFIGKLKTDLIEVSGGIDEETGNPKSLDQREKPANYLLNQKNATVLKENIEKYRAELLKHAAGNAQLEATIKQTFDTGKQKVGKDGVEVNWENANFEHFPLAAILPFLTDIQAKVRNTESDVISLLQRNIGATDLKFTGIRPIVMPKSTYVTQGDEYEAQVFVAAYDDTQEPTITINGNPLPAEQINGGIGTVKFKAGSVGTQKWAGVIKIEQMGKDAIEIPVEGEYTVAPPTAVISPTKMNVLYRGVDNPLEIGVPGVDPSKIIVGGPGVSGSNGQYMANVTNVDGKEINISVSVKEEDGSTRSVGSKQFRIKGVPPAQGTIYKKTGGILSANAVSNATLEASLPDFPFDLTLEVVSFEIAIPGFPPEQIRGNRLTSDAKTRIAKLRPGSPVTFREIRARGPKGLTVNASSISVDVN